MDVELLENERLDALHRNGYFIIQEPKRFCFGMDAVLLSGFARVKRGERAIDLGTGTGIIPILLEAKTGGAHFTGLEIQPESAGMARRDRRYQGCLRTVWGIFFSCGDDKPALHDRKPRADERQRGEGHRAP